MNMKCFKSNELMQRLRDNLVAVEQDRLAGKYGYSLEEIDIMLKKVIKESLNKKQK